MREYLSVANNHMVWILASFTVLIMIIQTILFRRAAIKTAKSIGMPKEITDKAFRVGLVSSIGPALGVFIVIVGVIGSIGSPMAWLRCSVIGSAGTELYGATIGAKVAGTSLGGEGYDLRAMALSWISMTLNGSGWMLFVAFFTPVLDKVRVRVSGGDSKWLATFSLATCIGMFGFLTQGQLVSGLGPIVSVSIGAISMIVLNKYISKKFPKIKEFSLGIAMLLGIISAIMIS